MYIPISDFLDSRDLSFFPAPYVTQNQGFPSGCNFHFSPNSKAFNFHVIGRL